MTMAPELSLSEAIDSRSCVQPGCIFDAEPGSEYCGEHPRRGKLQRGDVTPERLELARRARALRDEGKLFKEISVALGVSYTYAQALVDDPDGAKARDRKDRYRQPCPKCGEPMCGSDGVGGAPGQCAKCSIAAQHEERFWTPERIIESFQAFHAQFGRTPTPSDTSQGQAPSQRIRLSAERLGEIDEAAGFGLPWPSVVTRELGSWRNAVAAAGLVSPPTGGTGHRLAIPLGRGQVATLGLLADGLQRPSEIARARGIHDSSAWSSLLSLVDRGLVARVSRGVYALADGVDPAHLQGVAMARQFTVFTRNGTGWKETGQLVEALNGDLAIEQVAEEAGEYVAVETRFWQPVSVAPVNRLAVIRDTSVA